MTKKHNTLGGKIQRCRKGLGISQEELAQRLGVSRQSVAKWETGQSVPDLNRLVTLADILGASLDYLLRDTIPQEAAATECVSTVRGLPSAVPDGGHEVRFSDGPFELENTAGMMVPEREAGCLSAAFREEKSRSLVSESRADALDLESRDAEAPGNVGLLSSVKTEEHGPGASFVVRSSSGRALADCSREPFGFSTRRIVAACGMALVTVGLVGLATLWVLSEMHPVQLTMWDGSLREGIWGFVLAHNLDKVFFATCGTALGGVVLLSGVWISSRRAR